MKYYLVLVLAVSFVCFGCSTQNKPTQPSGPLAQVSIIPKPHSVKLTHETPFYVTAATEIYYDSGKKGFKKTANQLAHYLNHKTGFELTVNPMGDNIKENAIILKRAVAGQDLSDECYILDISSNKIVIQAPTSAGAFYGVQSLRQLMPTGLNKGPDAQKWTIKTVKIKDKPRFSWRGMQIDVSRHFFSIETLEEFIDYMAYYKFNRLHLHLTDDQGWRLQIKQYPKLTEEGAWRTFNSQDSVAIQRAKTNPAFELPKQHIKMKDGHKVYGGFYTQKEMKRLIRYAKDRHIVIVPEIDMPGHLMEAIKQYPYLSCTGKAAWGQTFSVPVCPGKKSTYTFLENVLDEVAALFPGKYVHIGADEVEKTTWKNSKACQKLMKKKGLGNVKELQSYFVSRMSRYLQSKGKVAIGWDEIAEGGIPDGMVMMYWRSWAKNAPKVAAKNGNKIIMTPNSVLYFNVKQTSVSLKNVYEYDTVPKSFTAQQAKFILGAQGNLWTEWIPSKQRLFHMAMPRMLALSEMVWSQKDDRSWKGFTQRIQKQYTFLDIHDVNYRQPDLKGFHPKNVFIDTAVVNIEKPRKITTLYYSLDGSEPTRKSKEYMGPFKLTKPATVRFKTYLPTGAAGQSYTAKYIKEQPKPGARLKNPQQGLKLAYDNEAYHSVKEFHFDADNNVQQTTVNSFTVPKQIGKMPVFGLKFTGYIKVPATGVYTFYTSTDDGSMMWVDGQMVVNNDGAHSEIEKTTAQIALKAGYHKVKLKFFELGGGFALHVYYEGPGITKQRIPAGQLFYEK